MYIGEKVKLREYRKEDMILAQKFLNDAKVKRLMNSNIPFLYTYEDEEKWFQNQSAMNDLYNFAIETLEEKKYIGGCGINKLDWKNSVATIGIFIGNEDYWGKGYGSDALNILIKFIFEQMNIHKIKLGVYSYNKRAIKCYEKCGFKKEGVLREELFRDGKYHDVIIMGILKDEYYIE